MFLKKKRFLSKVKPALCGLIGAAYMCPTAAFAQTCDVSVISTQANPKYIADLQAALLTDPVDNTLTVCVGGVIGHDPSLSFEEDLSLTIYPSTVHPNTTRVELIGSTDRNNPSIIRTYNDTPNGGYATVRTTALDVLLKNMVVEGLSDTVYDPTNPFEIDTGVYGSQKAVRIMQEGSLTIENCRLFANGLSWPAAALAVEDMSQFLDNTPLSVTIKNSELSGNNKDYVLVVNSLKAGNEALVNIDDVTIFGGMHINRSAQGSVIKNVSITANDYQGMDAYGQETSLNGVGLLINHANLDQIKNISVSNKASALILDTIAGSVENISANGVEIWDSSLSLLRAVNSELLHDSLSPYANSKAALAIRNSTIPTIDGLALKLPEGSSFPAFYTGLAIAASDVDLVRSARIIAKSFRYHHADEYYLQTGYTPSVYHYAPGVSIDDPGFMISGQPSSTVDQVQRMAITVYNGAECVDGSTTQSAINCNDSAPMP